MAGGVARAALACWCACALAAAAAQRFGDRLAPRVPAAYAPRHAPAAHYSEPDYDDAYEHDYEEQDLSAEEPDPPPPTPAPAPASAPRRPARTEAHRLEMSTEFFMLPERSSAAPPPPTPPKRALPPASTRPANTSAGAVGAPVTALRQEPWAVPVLALACGCMLTIGGFEAFVVYGARRQAPSHRHLLLGQTLLFGLFACAATAALLATTPTALTCGAVRFGTGVSYVVVFASLLVKCVFLLSLNGGVYLPAAYQGLLLFFAVMIQVAIGAQWVGGAPGRALGGRCEGSLAELLLSLSYAAFLVAVVCGVALRSRGIRDNYREATHIAGAAGATAAVWACWVAAALAAAERHRDACVAAGLLATCACVFALMFAPKGRRLAALGREGRWDADREEGLSSLGGGAGPGSNYSPSFFHFKPVKYGMVSPAAAAAPPADRKEPPAQPADPYGAMFNSPHLHSRFLYSPPHYPMHPPFHYPYNYPPYPYLLPPGASRRDVAGRGKRWGCVGCGLRGGRRVRGAGAHLQQQPQRVLPALGAAARRHDVLSPDNPTFDRTLAFDSTRYKPGAPSANYRPRTNYNAIDYIKGIFQRDHTNKRRNKMTFK